MAGRSAREATSPEARMHKVLVERNIPADVRINDTAAIGRMCRGTIASLAKMQGKVHWLRSYVTDDQKLFSILVVESKDALTAYMQLMQGVLGADLVAVREVLEFDPSYAD
jgi:hypothetical protein